jgi:esterase/lipase superfamily enzyme
MSRSPIPFLLVVITALVLLTGCQSAPVRLMPTPVPLVDGYVDPFTSADVAIEGTEVPVFYATNRAVLVEKPEPVHLSIPSPVLRFGVANVRIGDETLDWEALHRLSTSADESERPILTLESMEQLASLGTDENVAESEAVKAFFERINEALAASPNAELVVYVHGSNNTVPRASAQASQFRHFTGRRMVVVAFMWPSAGSLLRYLTDVGNAAATVETFARFIEMLGKHTNASMIDVLAYSAGAQVISPALARLGEAREGESREDMRRRLRLGQVYFAAPDIDTRRFVDDMKAYVDLTDRVTLALNLNDSVLRFASMVSRASRAGRPDVSELSAEQTQFLVDSAADLRFDVVNVNPEDIPNLPRGSHDFWFGDAWVSGDLLVQFLLNRAPPGRGLELQTSPTGKPYWMFPPDFDQRVRRIVFEAMGPGGDAGSPEAGSAEPGSE